SRLGHRPEFAGSKERDGKAEGRASGSERIKIPVGSRSKLCASACLSSSRLTVSPAPPSKRMKPARKRCDTGIQCAEGCKSEQSADTGPSFSDTEDSSQNVRGGTPRDSIVILPCRHIDFKASTVSSKKNCVSAI